MRSLLELRQTLEEVYEERERMIFKRIDQEREQETLLPFFISWKEHNCIDNKSASTS